MIQQDDRSLIGRPQSVLFVCTANIFRSGTAVYARGQTGCGQLLRRSFSQNRRQASADACWVQSQLRAKGADPASHVQRPLTGEMFDAADLVMAMGHAAQTSRLRLRA